METNLRPGDMVGIISCSDGIKLESENLINNLNDTLINLGLTTVYAKTIFKVNNTPFSGSPRERADGLMKLFLNPNIKAIFDISGGDSANQILPLLNYEQIKNNNKPFFGISDLSVILNAIFSQSNIPTYHFQISTIVNNNSQLSLFQKLFFSKNSLPDELTFEYSFLRGKDLSGIVIGGNIRCFLKLAGTIYMPDPTDKVLFLESLGGGPNRTASLIAQIEQLGFFRKCKGILLGTFTEMEREKLIPTVEELIMEITDKYQLPLVKTNQLGHGLNGHCISIGRKINLT